MIKNIKCEHFGNDEYNKNLKFDTSAEYKIFYLESGNAIFQVENKNKYCLSSGDVMLLLPYEKHKLSGKVSRFYEIFFDGASISEQIYDDVLKCFSEYKKFNFSSIKNVISHICERISNEMEEEKSYRDIVCDSLLNRLFVEILRTVEDDTNTIKSDEQAIMNVVEFIDKNYNKKITVEEMMKVACMGYSSFQQKFKKYIGMTPNDYLNKTRISISIKFLINHSLTTEDVAKMVGMKSASYYCSQFKKYMKVTPRQYGKALDNTLNHFNSRKIIYDREDE